MRLSSNCLHRGDSKLTPGLASGIHLCPGGDKLKKENFPVQTLGGDAFTKVYDFCGALGGQWTRDSFFDNSTLHAIGLKFNILFWLFIYCF